MIDQLTSNNPPKLSAEISTGFNRLQALLQIGETINAQVVSVVAQPPRSRSQPADGRQALQPPPSAPTRGSNQTGATENRAATSPQSQAAPTEYRIRVQVQGQTLELISTKPLPPGSEIQLSRTSDNRVLLQPPTQPTPSPSTTTTSATHTPSSGSTTPSPASGSPGSTLAVTPNLTAPLNPNSPAPAQANTQTTAQQQRLAALLPQPNQAVTARVVESRPTTSSATITTTPLRPGGTTQPVYGDPRISATVRAATPPDLTVLLQTGAPRVQTTPPLTPPVGQATPNAHNTPAPSSQAATASPTNANPTTPAPPSAGSNATAIASNATATAQANLAQAQAATSSAPPDAAQARPPAATLTPPTANPTQPASGSSNTAAASTPPPTATYAGSPATGSTSPTTIAASATTASTTNVTSTTSSPAPATTTSAPSAAASAGGSAAGSTHNTPIAAPATTASTPNTISTPPSSTPTPAPSAAASASGSPAGPPPSPPVAAPATTASAANTTSSNGQSAHRTLLTINGHNLEVTTPKAIPVGTEVKAIRSADGQLTLQLPAPRAAAVNAALLKHLPRQQPPDELFNQLSALSNNAAVRQAQPLLMSLISLLLGRTLAKPTEPNPKGVRQQLLNGGSLLESKLAHADRTNLAQDQKALLLKLAQQLPQGGARELPSGDSERLQQLVQQAISRVISNQIHSLGSQASQDREGEATRMLVTDIPVQGQTGRHETVHVHIKEQHSSATETEQAPPRWQVELSFKIAGLPPMSATLTLEQQQISLVWQGESGTRHLLQPRLGQLQQRLEGLGLEVAVLGVRDRSERRPGTQPGTALIDVET